MQKLDMPTKPKAKTSILRRYVRSRLASWLCAIDAHLWSLAGAMRNGEVKAIKFRHKQCCPSARGRRNLRQALITLKIKLLKNTEEAVAAGDINSSAGIIVEDVIRISSAV
jgi:hypothetical protein